MKAQIAAKYIQFLSNKKANKNSGFTLIELLVVIIIIGILSAIALPSFLNQAAKARASEARTNVGAMNRSQQAYYLENQTFAPDATNVPPVLGLGISSTDNYGYRAATVTNVNTDIVNYATPATGKTDLKAYSGGVFKATDTTTNTTTTASILCETAAAGSGTTVAAAGAPSSATVCGGTLKKLN